ncbi:MAG: hypothetical protein LBR26_13870 [Prevotella sp.]|jgi:hypothetical protein|nr:hypothetical protein [Prevotella sp.]
MKRGIIFTGFLFLTLCLLAQTAAEQKKEIAKIKKSDSYLYGEATLASQKEAVLLAEEILQENINAWVQQDKALRKADNVIIRNTGRDVSRITLPRGNMFQAFLYVKKSDILSADNAKVVAVDKSGPESTVEPVVPPDEPSVAPSVEEPTDEALRQVLGLAKFDEISTCLQRLKQEGKISDFNKYAALKRPGEYYLIIYNRDALIEAVLGKGEDKRPNLKTGLEDSITNYKGRGAIGFKLAE